MIELVPPVLGYNYDVTNNRELYRKKIPDRFYHILYNKGYSIGWFDPMLVSINTIIQNKYSSAIFNTIIIPQYSSRIIESLSL